MVFPEDMKTKFMSPLFVFQKDGTVVTSEDYLKSHKEETLKEKLPEPTPASPAKKI